MKSGPIIIVEDDADDKEVLEGILQELKVANKLIWFTRSDEAIEFLRTTPMQPFIILSDINLPGESGIDFKGRIDADPQLRKKSIPFIFYSTSVNQQAVNVAYTQMMVQGFFQKGSSYEEIKRNMESIIDYWQRCKHPNSM